MARKAPQKAMGCILLGMCSMGSLGKKNREDQHGHEAVDAAMDSSSGSWASKLGLGMGQSLLLFPTAVILEVCKRMCNIFKASCFPSLCLRVKHHLPSFSSHSCFSH